MKHQLLIFQLTLFTFVPLQYSFPQVVSSSHVYLWKYALPCHVFRWLHLPFFGIASQNEWGTELMHLYFSCNHLSFFNSESERNAVDRNKAIHLCWAISFKYGWKCECKRELLGEPSLLKDCLKCSYKWLGTLLCRSMHDVEVTSSSWVNHHSTAEVRETDNLQNLSILSIRNLWEWCYSWFLVLELLIFKYRSLRLSCEQLLCGCILITKKTKRKVSYRKILDEFKISNTELEYNCEA